MKPEIRKDYLQDRYVLIAPHADTHAPEIVREEPLNPAKTTCPYCPAHSDKQKALLTLGPKKHWRIKALADRHPLVSIDNPKAFGEQEVIIETPNHIVELEDLPEEHIEQLLQTYAQRIRALSKDEKHEYILVQKTRGGRANSPLHHAHSHILATAFLSPNAIDRSQKSLAYRLNNRSCVFCDVAAKEESSKRFVWADNHVVAFTPYASFHNYEVWIVPRSHRASLTQCTLAERASLAKSLKHLLRAVSDLHLPYRFSFDQILRDTEQHFILKLFPLGRVWSSIDFAPSLPVNSVSPEEAASYYQEALQL